MAERASDRCMGCGQVDDHPKCHYAMPTGTETFHFDCMPYSLLRDYTTTGFWQVEDNRLVWVDGEEIPEKDLSVEIRNTLKARELAQKGTRGPKLLTAITKLHEEG